MIVKLPENHIRVPCEANADPFQSFGVLYSSNPNNPTASLTPRVTGEHELKQAKKTSDQVSLPPRKSVHRTHADIKA